MYFARIARSLPAIRTPKCRSSEKYGLCGKRSLKSSSAVLCNVPCAYGGLLSGTFHVLISFQGFVPSPGYHVRSPKLSMISGALFFLLPLNYTRTASPVESFCHNGLVQHQFCWFTASNSPAFDSIEAGKHNPQSGKVITSRDHSSGSTFSVAPALAAAAHAASRRRRGHAA